MQILRLDQHVIELDLFILAAELLAHFVVAGRDAIGHQLLELLLQQRIFHFRFKLRDAHLKARLDFRGVPVHADKGVAGKRRGHELLQQVGVLFVRDAQAHAVGFERQHLFIDQLVERLLRIGRQEGGRNLAAAGSLAQLVLDIDDGDGLVSHLGDGVRPGQIVGALRHEVQQHADPQKPDDDSEHDPHA